MKSNSSLTTSMLAISGDGHIRLRLAELKGIHLKHLVSGLDEDIQGAAHLGALHTTISGYTEWVSETTPAISIGWDWQMHGAARLLRIGEPRSNLLLQDVHHIDMDYFKSATFLEAFVDTLEWQAVVLRQIVVRYS